MPVPGRTCPLAAREGAQDDAEEGMHCRLVGENPSRWSPAAARRRSSGRGGCGRRSPSRVEREVLRLGGDKPLLPSVAAQTGEHRAEEGAVHEVGGKAHRPPARPVRDHCAEKAHVRVAGRHAEPTGGQRLGGRPRGRCDDPGEPALSACGSYPHRMDTLSLETRRRLTLAATTLGSSLAFIDATVVIVALPTIERDLDLGLAGAAVGLPLLLPRTRRPLPRGRRRRRPLRPARQSSSLARRASRSPRCSPARRPTETVLILARTLQGVAGAFLTTNSLALLRGVYGDDAGRAIGLWTSFTSVATIAGPPVGRGAGGVGLVALDLLHQPAACRPDRTPGPPRPLRRAHRRTRRAARPPGRRPRSPRLRLPDLRARGRSRERLRRSLVGVSARCPRADRVRRRREPYEGADAALRPLPAAQLRRRQRGNLPRLRRPVRVLRLLHPLPAVPRIHAVRGGPHRRFPRAS